MTEETEKSNALALVARSATPEQSVVLQDWLTRLLQIRGSSDSRLTKAKAALEASASRELIWPIIKVIAKTIKMYGWDKRTAAQKRFIAAASLGLAVFGNTGAGVAALGTAIGVPLWIVLGAGNMFALELLDSLKNPPGE